MKNFQLRRSSEGLFHLSFSSFFICGESLRVPLWSSVHCCTGGETVLTRKTLNSGTNRRNLAGTGGTSGTSGFFAHFGAGCGCGLKAELLTLEWVDGRVWSLWIASCADAARIVSASARMLRASARYCPHGTRLCPRSRLVSLRLSPVSVGLSSVSVQ